MNRTNIDYFGCPYRVHRMKDLISSSPEFMGILTQEFHQSVVGFVVTYGKNLRNRGCKDCFYGIHFNVKAGVSIKILSRVQFFKGRY